MNNLGLKIMKTKIIKDEQLEAAKRKQQALSRALVSSGVRTQVDVFIPSDIAKSLKIRHSSVEFWTSKKSQFH